jgi:hypothetical protein
VRATGSARQRRKRRQLARGVAGQGHLKQGCTWGTSSVRRSTWQHLVVTWQGGGVGEGRAEPACGDGEGSSTVFILF